MYHLSTLRNLLEGMVYPYKKVNQIENDMRSRKWKATKEKGERMMVN